MIANKPFMSLELARLICREATRAAESLKLNAVVVVVDEGGHTVALERMDNAAYGQIDDVSMRARRAIAHQAPLDETRWDGGLCVHIKGLAIGALGIGAAGANSKINNPQGIDKTLLQIAKDVLNSINANHELHPAA